jgi:hypothetical protein
MAIFNEILSGRYNRALQKIYAIKGSPPVRQLAGEIQPSHFFYSGVETRAVEEWYRYGLLLTTVSGVGQAAARIRNPANSNRLVVFERILMCDDAAGAVVKLWSLETQTTAADLSGAFVIAANSSWDKRLNNASALVGSVSNGATALSLVRANVVMPPGGGNFEFITEEQQEVILSPGEAIQIRATVNATDVNASFWWRERKFEPEELNLGG